jgi:putative DNA primase/helicase
VLILEGNEGTGKSSVANILGGRWYANAFIDPKDKDTVSLINRSWIVEVAEMEVFKRAEANALKAFITRGTDNIRLPYEKIVRPIERHSVFLGTINPEDSGYLADDAENRRYWPVWTGKIDLAGLAEIRDQLFAEAYALYKEGKDALFLDTESLVAMQREEVEKRKQADPWVFLLGDYLKGNPTLDAITMRTICLDLLGMKPDRMRRGDQSRVGRVMKRLGWEHGVVDGQGGYYRPVHEILAREQKAVTELLLD